MYVVMIENTDNQRGIVTRAFDVTTFKTAKQQKNLTEILDNQKH